MSAGVTAGPKEIDDAALVLEAQRGERGVAFAKLYERHKDPVYGFLLRVLRDHALAEDVLQESFYRLYRSLDRCDAKRPFKPYLHRIVRSATLDALAARRKQRESAPPSEARAPSAFAEAAAAEESSRAREAYDALPEETRLLLFQRHGLDMGLDDLAASWDVTEKTIRNRLKVAARDLVDLFFRGGRS